MIFLFVFVSCLEVVGTGIIGPFMAIVTNPNSIESIHWLNSVYTQLNFTSEEQLVFFLGLLVIIAFYVKAFLSFKAQKAVFDFGFGLRGELAQKLMKAYIEAPYSFHLRVNSATIIQNVIASTENFCIGLVLSFLTSISNIIVILALVILLVKTDALALIFIAMIMLLALGLLKPMKESLANWGKDGWQASSEMIRIMNHGMGGLKETRVIGCESYFENQMEEQTKRYAKNLSMASAYGNLPRYVIEAFMISFLICFTLLFIKINQGNGQSLTAVLGIFALASIRLLPGIGNLISGINMVRINTHALDGLFFDFKELENGKLLPSIDFKNTSLSISSNQNEKFILFQENIILDKLTFQYPNATKKALDEISFTIRKGESIGIIGKSGSGKTTLVDVILGLFTPQSGDIKVDGVSVYDNLRAWQNILGYVPQSIFLIDDTLERNIAFGTPDNLIDQDRLRKAIEVAQLSEVVEQLPQGIKTVVGERGVLLSGGQRQRVGIARVLYHEREILVFDEATAALDNETEQLVTEATKALSGNKTIIIIAHRLQTIEHCDCIYQIEKGRIVKSGNYKEVILEK
ncbi:ABC transporter ATP-binding protein [Calothrix sp. UHCC 0171]|uniref:ABC transporter ATP-binding protein n=1 Tax=Calothrix sp. UHCC 0171 TaxID=3110245 RepID=UPI002B20D55E|nr:ABC transporter ATP-binding protein [Calothrix sp. UHCC 0171]MEA5573572.1 ABC transporter ATP-binding protein [Calothrix sp. UHCC 0171]